MNEEMTNVAMQIILNAGDARNHVTSAMGEELKGNRDEADKLFLLARECVKKAHLYQTEVIQDEARGNEKKVGLLFIHAQDTLMTIVSEINLIEQMIKMNRRLEDKINENCK